MSAEPQLTSDVIGLTKVAPFSRRGFMTASAAVTAGYTLAAGPVRADAIKTDTGGLADGEAKIKVTDGEMPGYFARPAGVSNPPVVLVAMEIFGLHEYIKDVTRRLAKLGALAVAPDYYFRKGDLSKITDIPQLMPLVNSKPDAELLSDLDSTVAWAKSQGGDTARLGIVGFCRGGRTVWEYDRKVRPVDDAGRARLRDRQASRRRLADRNATAYHRAAARQRLRHQRLRASKAEQQRNGADGSSKIPGARFDG